MNNKFFTGAKVLCPACNTRNFVQDQPWKLVCVGCYMERKGNAAPIAKPKPIELEMLRRLIQLCHPDKHANSEASNMATRFLLALKEATQ